MVEAYHERFRSFKPRPVTRFDEIVGKEEAARVGRELLLWMDHDYEDSSNPIPPNTEIEEPNTNL